MQKDLYNLQNCIYTTDLEIILHDGRIRNDSPSELEIKILKYISTLANSAIQWILIMLKSSLKKKKIHDRDDFWRLSTVQWAATLSTDTSNFQKYIYQLQDKIQTDICLVILHFLIYRK